MVHLMDVLIEEWTGVHQPVDKSYEQSDEFYTALNVVYTHNVLDIVQCMLGALTGVSSRSLSH